MRLVRDSDVTVVPRFVFESQASTPFTTKRVVNAATGQSISAEPVTTGEAASGVYSFAVPGAVTTAEVSLLLAPAVNWHALPLTSTYHWEISTGAATPADIATGGRLLAREPTIPSVAIVSPRPGTSILVTRPVSLEARATDMVDGTLPTTTVQWIADTVGYLGRGSLAVTTLSVGIHHLTAAARNSAMTTGVDVTVLAVRAPVPSAIVTSPVSGTVVTFPQSLALSGAGSSELVPAYSASAFQWRSDLQGTLATGTTQLTTSLAPGSHFLTLRVFDSQYGTQGTSTVRVTVLPPRPQIQIVRPTSGSWFVTGSTTALNAIVALPPGNELAQFPVRWFSEKAGLLATGATPSTVWATPGYDTLTALVTSPHGTAVTTSVSTVVVPTAPLVAVLSPRAGNLFPLRLPVRLEGLASDPTSGPCPAAACSWESSVQGSLGAGPVVVTTSLVLGIHQLRFHAVSAGGQPVTSTVTVTVVPRVPSVAITQPESSTPFSTGTAVILEARAADELDGPLSPDVYRWSVPALSWTTAGNPVQLPGPAPGSYTATVSVTNSTATSATSTTQFLVTTRPVAPAILVVGRVTRAVLTPATTLTVTLTEILTGRVVSSAPPGPGGPGTYRCSFPSATYAMPVTTHLDFTVGYFTPEGVPVTGVTTRFVVTPREAEKGPVIRDLDVGSGP